MTPSSRTGGATSTFLSEMFNSTGSYQVRLAGLPLKRFWMENIKVLPKCEKTENEFHYCHNFNILISSLCPMSLKVRMIFTKCQPCACLFLFHSVKQMRDKMGVGNMATTSFSSRANIYWDLFVCHFSRFELCFLQLPNYTSSKESWS